ncbi:Phospholipase A1 @ Outer membrane phospholipase A, partial [hydrothermal vent metagenome]
LVWNARVWWRIPEDEKESPTDLAGDDNPDIEKYMGHGELGVLWKLPRKNNIDMMLRNNLRSDNKGAVRLGWSFPLADAEYPGKDLGTLRLSRLLSKDQSRELLFYELTWSSPLHHISG